MKNKPNKKRKNDNQTESTTNRIRGPVRLGKTGVNGINRASKERQSDLRVKVGDYVHKECRATYIHKLYISSSSSECSSSSRGTRSSIGRFDFRKNCFLCGQPVTEKE